MSGRNWLTTKCYQCSKSTTEESAFVINEENDLVFCSEECLQAHFAPQIETLAKELEQHHPKDDISEKKYEAYADCLDQLLEQPSEIWEDTETFSDITVHNFIGEFQVEEETIYYLAVVYLTGDTPSFVFLHFPTRDVKLVEIYRRGRLIFDRSQAEIEIDASESDALSEGDELAKGLYQAMMRLRNGQDISEEDFSDYLKFRQETIEAGDEMWRSTDLQGNTLVTFIREFSSEDIGDLFYIVVTVEDVVSGSHFILFSFPTRDGNLVDRYRHGQNLESDGLVRQESH